MDGGKLPLLSPPNGSIVNCSGPLRYTSAKTSIDLDGLSAVLARVMRLGCREACRHRNATGGSVLKHLHLTDCPTCETKAANPVPPHP